MPRFLYQCLLCGGMHEVSVRPGGAMYLRCVVTQRWAWHDPSRFLSEEPAVGPRKAAASNGNARRAAKAPARKAAATHRPPAASKRAVPRTAARKATPARAAAPKRKKR